MQIIDNSTNKFVSFLIAGMISCFFIFDMTSVSSISIIVTIFVLLCAIVLQNAGKVQIVVEQFHIRCFIFAGFCLMSSVWAWEPSYSIDRGITIIETLICMSIVFLLYQESLSIDGFLVGIMWSGVVICVYTIAYYGAENFVVMSENASRLGNDFANSNAIGMWMAVVIVIYVDKILNKKWNFQNIFLVFPIILMAMSQSRTALAETLIGIVILIILRFGGDGEVLKRISSVIFALLLVFMLLYFLSKLEIFSGISKRMLEYFTGTGRTGGSLTQRAEYREIGWNQFLRTPLLGIGIGNSYELTARYSSHATYLHNNFLELLAGGGIIGFGIYYSIHLYLVKNLFCIRKNDPENANTNICIAIIIMHTVSDWGTVCYYKKYTYLIFVLCFLQLYISKRDQIREEETE